MESARCKAFMYAADTGSFTKAAERLNYTPSGVSQLVGALENETGLTLLKRTRKGVTLTSDGEILLPAVREFLEKEMESGIFKKVPLPFIFMTLYSQLAFPFLSKNLTMKLFFNEDKDTFNAFLQEWKQHIISQITYLLKP